MTDYWRQHLITPEIEHAYLASASDPHRDWAVEGLLSLGGVSTVLEVGCHCGPLLRRLVALQGITAVGVDVNVQAVALARQAGLHAEEGALPHTLCTFGDRTVDAAVSSYCLAYLAPYDAVVALRHLVRIVRVGFVLVEPMAGAGVPPGALDDAAPSWRHDYFRLLDVAVSGLLPAPRVSMTRQAKGPHAGINGMVVARLVA